MKVRNILLSAIFLLSMTGCQTSNKVNESTSKSSSDFCLALYSDKRVYDSDDEIKIWSALEYKGAQESVVIWHDNPLIGIIIVSLTDNFIWDPLSDLTLCPTTINSKEKIIQDFFKPTNLSTEEIASITDEKMKEFLQNPKVSLPEGKYEIKAITRLSLSQDPLDSKDDIKLETNLKINVRD